MACFVRDIRNLNGDENCKTKIRCIRGKFGIERTKFVTALPIYAERKRIVTKVQENQVCIILGETGSGKSTQMVQYLHESGDFSQGKIICTQPRKVAAMSLAKQVAVEQASQMGQVVDFHLGSHVKHREDTKILFTTDHTLLNECLKDRLLSKYSCIIIDEAHERSMFTDMLLGMIKEILPLRSELRVIITSATIDPKVFQDYCSVRKDLSCRYSMEGPK